MSYTEAAQAEGKDTLMEDLDRLAKVLDAVGSRLSVLEQRLSPVLRPEGPEKAEPDSINAVPAPRSPARSVIGIHTRTVQEMEHALMRILGRLEL